MERVNEMLKKKFEYILVRDIKYIQSSIRQEYESLRTNE